VRLVGVADIGRDPGQVGDRPGVDAGQEPAEPKHPVQERGTTTDGVLAPAAQLPLADLQLLRDQVSAGPRPVQPAGRLEHEAVRRALRHHLGRRQRNTADRLTGRQPAVQPPVRDGGQVGASYTQVEQLTEGHAERGTASSGPEPGPDQNGSRLAQERRWPGVGAGNEDAAPALPDQVGAGVRKHKFLMSAG
jgi:hypothetical protein